MGICDCETSWLGSSVEGEPGDEAVAACPVALKVPDNKRLKEAGRT